MAVINPKRLVLVSTVLAVAACTVADSESVLTSGMSAYIDVIESVFTGCAALGAVKQLGTFEKDGRTWRYSIVSE